MNETEAREVSCCRRSRRHSRRARAGPMRTGAGPTASPRKRSPATRRRRPSSPSGPGMRCSACWRASRPLRRWISRPTRDGPWLLIVAVVALALGLFADAIGNDRRINLLAPPYWGVLLWNLVVYVLLVAHRCWPCCAARRAAAGPLRRAMQAMLRWGRQAPSGRRGPSAGPLAAFAELWAARSASTASLRAQTLLHVGAAALALGLVAGLYLRGLVLDYRVGWESTFLAPPTVQRRADDAALAGGDLRRHRPARRGRLRRPADAARRRRGRRARRDVDPSAGADPARGRRGPAPAPRARHRGAGRRGGGGASASTWGAVFPAPGAPAARQRRRGRGASLCPRALAAGDARPAGAARRGVRAARRGADRPTAAFGAADESAPPPRSRRRA